MFSTKYSPDYSMKDIQKIFEKDKFYFEISEDDINFAKGILEENIDKVKCHQTYLKYILNNLRKRQVFQSKTHILKAYYILLQRKEINYDSNFIKFGSIKSTRGCSGVQVITIFTSGSFMGKENNHMNKDMNKDIEEFNKTGGCPMNCYYCPFEKDENGIPTQPRSYLSTEPGNKRATQNKHHPLGQMFDRLYQLEQIGHIPSIYMDDDKKGAKLEIIISGGTFNFYPKDYIYWFVTCMYYSANIYYNYRLTNYIEREMLSLEEEQKINETTKMRIIGLTIETRPDYLIPKESINMNIQKNSNVNSIQKDNRYEIIQFFRELGITRVQIGIQHTNDIILKKVNRQCTDKQNKYAIKFLKDNGFKVDIHIMLDLPFSSPEEDISMLNKILTNEEYEADQWKIYPTETTPFTVIKKWYDEGKYIPYADGRNNEKLIEVIMSAKKIMKPWIRINRIVRDIPSESIEGGINCPEMRDIISHKMKELGIYCKCIRCREIKLEIINDNDIKQFIRHYIGSDGDEYFISYETFDEKKLIGFIRLRLNKTFNNSMPELNGYAFIRELHVLGHHTTVGTESKGVQHKGYGSLLLQKAEEIAYKNGYIGISIISGVGVREYYEKKGYHLHNHNMVKVFNKKCFINDIYNHPYIFMNMNMNLIHIIIILILMLLYIELHIYLFM